MDKQALERALLKIEKDGWWDEETMESDEIFFSSPFVNFIKVLHDFDRTALYWLTYFAAKKVASKYYLATDELSVRKLKILQRLNKHFKEDSGINLMCTKVVEHLHNLKEYLEGDDNIKREDLLEIVSKLQEIQSTNDEWLASAEESLQNCVRYLIKSDHLAAVDCICDADRALELYEEIDFRKWLIEIALPSALKKESLPEEAFKSPNSSNCPTGNTWKIVYFPPRN